MPARDDNAESSLRTRQEVFERYITSIDVDAIINAANETLLGVDGEIHRTARPELLRECRGIGGCPRGEARIICDYDLPAAHMIHAVRRIWRSGSCGESTLLASFYQEWLILASLYEVRIIAFPTISAGVYRCSLAATTPIASQDHRRISTGDGGY